MFTFLGFVSRVGGLGFRPTVQLVRFFGPEDMGQFLTILFVVPLQDAA